MPGPLFGHTYVYGIRTYVCVVCLWVLLTCIANLVGISGIGMYRCSMFAVLATRVIYTVWIWFRQRAVLYMDHAWEVHIPVSVFCHMMLKKNQERSGLLSDPSPLPLRGSTLYLTLRGSTLYLTLRDQSQSPAGGQQGGKTPKGYGIESTHIKDRVAVLVPRLHATHMAKDHMLHNLNNRFPLFHVRLYYSDAATVITLVIALCNVYLV